MVVPSLPEQTRHPGTTPVAGEAGAGNNRGIREQRRSGLVDRHLGQLADPRPALLALRDEVAHLLEPPEAEQAVAVLELAAARERGARVLLYEGGEAWRFDEYAIDAGVRGSCGCWRTSA